MVHTEGTRPAPPHPAPPQGGADVDPAWACNLGPPQTPLLGSILLSRRLTAAFGHHPCRLLGALNKQSHVSPAPGPAAQPACRGRPRWGAL